MILADVFAIRDRKPWAQRACKPRQQFNAAYGLCRGRCVLCDRRSIVLSAWGLTLQVMPVGIVYCESGRGWVFVCIAGIGYSVFGKSSTLPPFWAVDLIITRRAGHSSIF